MIPPPHERGAALLTVLLLVAMMAVIAAVMLERLNLATRLAANGQSAAEARMIALGSEQLVAGRIDEIVRVDQERTVDRLGLLDREQLIPLQRGTLRMRIRDAGNCFNLNSVVGGEPGNYVMNPEGLEQFRSLMRSLEVPEGEAIVISDALADWIDSDDQQAPNGAEDSYYRSQSPSYRTSATLVTEPSELRAIKAVTPAIYERLRGWVCALPVAELSSLNINTLRADQARLITMLDPDAITVERARSVLAGRPETGFATKEPFVAGLGAGSDLPQLMLRSRWFEAAMAVTVGDATVHERLVIDLGTDKTRIVSRSWGEDL